LLISARELHELIRGGSGVTLFDCRFKLADKTWGQEQYQQGHIPHALYLDLEKDLSSAQTEHGGRHPFPDTQEFAQKLGSFGVAKHVPVVVYDSGEGMATRAWWLIRYFGHPDVRVLNGGLEAWVGAGYGLAEEVPVPDPVTFSPEIRADWTVQYTEVRGMVDGETRGNCLIDARAPKRYRGEIEPMDKIAGHIPGAANAPWQEGIDESGFWKAPELQRKRFESIVAENGETIVYCGSGVTACATLFGLQLAGIQDTKLYPGSWSDWISYADSPVATGDDKK
jgi:thiosulfate/3-mercaptopyruvate sulfurtransferase